MEKKKSKTLLEAGEVSFLGVIWPESFLYIIHKFLFLWLFLYSQYENLYLG